MGICTIPKVGTKMSKERKYLTYFDNEGFECLIDITSKENKMLLSAIKGDDNNYYKDDINLHAMMMRAQFNPQRSPEIWVFTSTVDLASLNKIKDNDPQMLADLIRSHGNSVFRGTPSTKRVIQ
jgi:hypothetical protein